MTPAAVIGGGYAVFLAGFTAALFGEQYRRHGERPLPAARRVYRLHVRDELRADLATMRTYSAVTVAHRAVTTLLMPAIIGRSVIHTVTYFVANPTGSPAADPTRLFRSPVEPRPLWNGLSARVVGCVLVVWYARTMAAAWAAALDSPLVEAYVVANAAVLALDPLAGIVLAITDADNP